MVHAQHRQTVHARSDKMKECKASAKDKKGDERKKFMRDRLKD
ncbi:MAG: hypothetical protein JSS57_09650 [Proteobacteria bacterium]|nr:hypothetical protein [Pseudomonadota bacterium]